MSSRPSDLARSYDLEDKARRLADAGERSAENARAGLPTSGLDAPQAVIARLEEIERELAVKQNAFEDAAVHWFREKRNKERQHAIEFRKARAGFGEDRTVGVADAQAWADECTALIGSEHEATYEAIKAKMKVLETRASIGQSILRSQSRT